jgi:CRP-like cAMP-binding protein
VPAEVPDARPKRAAHEYTKTVEEILALARATREIVRRPDDPILTFMKRIHVFAHLSDANREELRKRFFIKKFTKREQIFRRGEPGSYFYIIANGLVEVLVDDGMGNEKAVSVLSAGDCFGEMSILSGEPTSAHIRASTPVFCLALKANDFLNLVEEFPSINVALTKLIASRLRKTNLSLVEATVLQGVTGRLSMISLPELCQALSVNQRTGILEITGAGEGGGRVKGRILFSGGQVTDAVLPEISGDEAFYEMLSWPEGEFLFRQEDVAPDVRVSGDTMSLLMEGMRRMDESTRG